MATIIKADGQCIETQPKNGTDFKLEELNEIVGGYIEVLTLNDDQIMVINEEGKVYGLPLNLKATDMYGLDFIVGDVLVCEESEVK